MYCGKKIVNFVYYIIYAVTQEAMHFLCIFVHCYTFEAFPSSSQMHQKNAFPEIKAISIRWSTAAFTLLLSCG